ncbi:glycosyltransferase family 39 protein [uncultured Fluviicola sp.]|uniref:ArnT family glycosyltransferase n=1 Tax=uncultured Fluviicola sp. TaxID=463303 RepID=UPI0025DB1167|nr:glycosyltransferase family 39 protein [uncultured Fluviicola sp.]
MKTILIAIRDYYRNHTTLCNLFLLVGWLIINLIQAAFTGLAHDEAYYWMYSKNPDYGYFDHPPAIALLIKTGYAIFHNELGTRLLIVLMGTLFLWFTFLLTNCRNFLLFFILASSISCLEVYGFIAVPDAPLLFFTSTFFLLYKRWSENNRLVDALLLGLNIAALLYCKYHGLLIIFFTLISNLSLLKKKQFYLIVTISVVAYLPHIIWQINNDYPSYQYHVLTKSQDPYKPFDSLIFVLGQLMIAGPFTGILLFFSAFRYRVQSSTEKALRYTFIGFMVFFLLSTLNAPVEANWTVAAFVPILVLSYNYIASTIRLKKWLIGLSMISCILFLFIRINLAFDIVPAVGSKLIPEFYGWKTWAEQIEEKVGDTPVVFANSYQKASRYSFYTGNVSLSLNNIQYRRNQFDIWNIEDRLQGKRVVYIPNWKIEGDNVHTFQTNKEEIQYVTIDNFRSYAKINITTPQPRYIFKAGDIIQIPLKLKNNYGKPIHFGENPDYMDWLEFCVFHEEEQIGEEKILLLNGMTLFDSLETSTSFSAPYQKGVYYLRISIRHGWLPPGINSRLIRIIVE